MKKLTVLTTSLLAVLTLSSAAHAQIIVSQQFGLFNDHDIHADQLAGVVPAANFNVSPDHGNSSDTHVVQTMSASNLGGWDLTNLVNTSTTIGYSLTFDATFQSTSNLTTPNATNDNHLLFGPYFNRFTDDTPAPISAATLTINNLNSSDTYNLYVYFNAAFSNSGVSSTISLNGGTPFAITNNTSLATWTQSTSSSAVGNYVEFAGLTGMTLQSVAIATSEVGFTGFQIEDVGSAEAVPEPSTWAMLFCGLGALGFYGYRRKFRA